MLWLETVFQKWNQSKRYRLASTTNVTKKWIYMDNESTRNDQKKKTLTIEVYKYVAVRAEENSS